MPCAFWNVTTDKEIEEVSDIIQFTTVGSLRVLKHIHMHFPFVMLREEKQDDQERQYDLQFLVNREDKTSSLATALELSRQTLQSQFHPVA
jgi:hypothetical protein